jgi:hypothetical protein
LDDCLKEERAFPNSRQQGKIIRESRQPMIIRATLSHVLNLGNAIIDIYS